MMIYGYDGVLEVVCVSINESRGSEFALALDSGLGGCEGRAADGETLILGRPCGAEGGMIRGQA